MAKIATHRGTPIWGAASPVSSRAATVSVRSRTGLAQALISVDEPVAHGHGRTAAPPGRRIR